MFASGAPTWARQCLRAGQALKYTKTPTQPFIRMFSQYSTAARPLASASSRALHPFLTAEPQGDYLFDPCPKNRDYDLRKDFELREQRAFNDPTYFTFGDPPLPVPELDYENYEWQSSILGEKEKKRAANYLLRQKFDRYETLASVHSFIKLMKSEGVKMSLRTLTSLAEKYSDEGLFFNIDHVMGYMEEFGIKPDSEFIHALLKAYGAGAESAGVERVVEFGVRNGVAVDGEMKNLLVEYYASIDNKEKVEELLAELWEEGKDGSGALEETLPVFVNAYLEVMKMYCRIEDFNTAEKMFWDMFFKHRLKLDIPSFNLIFRSRMDAGDRLGARRMIAKYGEFKKVDCEVANAELFDGDEVTYNLFVQFLAAEYDQLNMTEMLEHMEDMMFEVHPDSYPAVLRASAVAGDERKMDEIWDWLERKRWPGKETLKRDTFHIGMSELLVKGRGYEAEKTLQQMDKEGHYPTRVTYRLMREAYLHRMDLERSFEILKEDYPKMDLPVTTDDSGLIYQAMYRNQGMDGILRCISYHEGRNEVPSLYALRNFFYSLKESFSEEEIMDLVKRIRKSEVFLVKQGWAIYVLIRGLMERNRKDLVEGLVLTHLERVPSESEFARYLHLLLMLHYNNQEVEKMEDILGRYETKTEPETRSYMLLRKLYRELGMQDKADGVTEYLRRRYIETPELERDSHLMFGKLTTKPDFWVEWEEMKAEHREKVLRKVQETIHRDDFTPVPLKEEEEDNPLEGIVD